MIRSKRSSEETSLGDVTIVVPTRNESENINPFLDRLLPLGPARVIFVDDSDDDTVSVIEARKEPRVEVIHRRMGEREGGLGGAVLRGFRAASTDWVAVIDGDLQHPPEVLVTMRMAARPPENSSQAAIEPVDAVVASRYLKGGSSDGLDGWHRKILSRFGTSLLRQTSKGRIAISGRLAAVTDPLSGCFLIRIDKVPYELLRPDGFKILLDIILSAPTPLHITEVPYRFESRAHGESNASMVEIIRLLRVFRRKRSHAR